MAPDNKEEVQSTVRFSTLGDEAKGKGQDVRDVLRPTMRVLLGPEQGRCFQLKDGMVIGRGPTCDLVLQDALISSRHLRIEVRERRWYLVDLKSTNGTRVNNEPCSEKQLSPHDKIQLGDTALRFELQDTTDLRYDEIMERLINIDDLSGLLLRRRFDMEWAEIVERSNREGKPAALLVMDLDGVKGINDNNGHLFGAYVIAESGKLIGRVVGERGIASRFGGDEFVAGLPGHDLDTGIAVAEEIRQAIADFRFEREGKELHPGISIGVAAVPVSARDCEELFQLADQALYRAKASGKNCVRG